MGSRGIIRVLRGLGLEVGGSPWYELGARKMVGVPWDSKCPVGSCGLGCVTRNTKGFEL